MSYTSKKVMVQKSTASSIGVFAKEKIKKGELIFNFRGGKGRFITLQERNITAIKWHHYDIQVGNNLFFTPNKKSEIETGDYVNHSCDPNVGIRRALKIVAMRNIEQGEEITFDYAMSESHNELNMKCHCGSLQCRKLITGNDWKIPALQKKYKGFFSDYLQQKIAALKKKHMRLQPPKI